jgi:hypothetical protein
MIYIISTILLTLILLGKVYFLNIEGIDSMGIFGITSVVVLISLLILGSVNYFSNRIKNNKKISLQFFSILSLVILAFSFYINTSKNVHMWDSVALYDARAKFMLQGMNFSQMVDLSKYDPQNSYYYVLYPPHTSLLHYYWYRLQIPLPIGVFYSFLLILLMLSIVSLINKRLGLTMTAFLAFVTISNNTIFLSSLSEYTNLPFTLQMFLGSFLLYEYLNDEKKWKLFYGAGLVITTMWIRFLEPLWIGAVLALFTALYIKKKFSKELLIPIFIGLYGIIEYLSWQNFVSGFGEITKIVSFSLGRIFEPIIGIFTGSLFSIFIFFVKSWGPILLVHIFAIVIALINRKKMNFLQLFMLFTILIYFSGLYFVSFQSTWWDKLGDSLVRGSTFMIPISGYIILEYLHGKKN